MFSKSTEYALRACIYIMRHSDETNRLGIPEIAEGIGAPEAFTAKILQKLSGDEAILSSVRGPGGGFYFTPKAAKTPLSKILQAMGEEEALDRCILGLEKCSSSKPCPMHEEYKEVRTRIQAIFRKRSLGDVSKGSLKFS